MIDAAAKTARAEALNLFLDTAGWGRAERRLLAGDASFRRYDRLSLDGRGLVLMDAPPPMETVRPFVRIARLLTELGFSAPQVIAVDEQNGFVLLEDLGDETYNRVLAGGGDERALYALAIDTLIALHRAIPQTEIDSLPSFDDARCQREVGLLLDWYWPAHFGSPAPESVRRDFVAAWQVVLPRRHAVPDSIAHFDFHIDNLMLLRDRPGIKACGLLDIQDAVRAPIAFDLVSLLEDVRRHVARDLVRAMIARYLEGNPAIARADFLTAYAVLGAQRNVRIAGTFARLLKRDGKLHYQSYMPRVWELVAQDIAAPALAPVADWFDRNLPPGDRVQLT